MAFEEFRRERAIRRVLRGAARQRVVIIANPGNAWVIERAIPNFDGSDEALQTCVLRGWLETHLTSIPAAQLTAEGAAHFDGQNLQFTGTQTIYRMTEAGWAALNRTHMWLLATFAVALATLVGTIAGVWLAWTH